MNILPQKLAMEIFNCHSEILRSKGLLEEIEKYLKTDNIADSTDVLRDAFGRQQHNLELGIPRGHGARSIVRLSPKLGKYIIEAHLAAMESELKELSVAATIALNEAPESEEK